MPYGRAAYATRQLYGEAWSGHNSRSLNSVEHLADGHMFVPRKPLVLEVRPRI